MVGALAGRLRRALREQRGAVIIAALFVLLATAYNLASPALEAPDEHLHYDFVRVLQQERRLPVVDLDGPLSEYHQPPLYYALAALASAPLPHGDVASLTIPNPFWGYQVAAVGRDNKNQFLHDPDRSPLNDPALLAIHLTRALSTLFGLGTVILTYHLARAFVPERTALAAMAVVAFIPNFLLTSAAITNDSLIVLLAAAAGLAVIRLAGRSAAPSAAHWAGLALLLGAGMLTKLSAWPLLPVSALGVALLARRLRSWRVFVLAGVILLGGVLVIGGWWVLRNLNLYGDPTGLSSMWAVWDRRETFTLADLAEGLILLRRTFWAAFGWGNIPVPGWVYALLDALTLGGIAGLVMALIRRDVLTPARRDQLLVAGAWFVLTLAALIWYMRGTYAVTGRQLYPVLPLIGLGLAAGWSRLWAHLPHRWQPALLPLTGGLMLALALGSLLGVLIPATSRSPRLTEQALQAQDMTPLNWAAADVAVLHGAALSETTVAPGSALDVTLFWQVVEPPGRNLTVFVHLIDGRGEIAGRRDTYPGLGNDPTIFWQRGEIIRDTIRVEVDPAASGPILLDVIAGLYDLETGQRLPVQDAAGNAIGYPVVGRVKLTGRPGVQPAPPVPVGADFAGGVALAGIDLADSAAAGETVPLALYWSASGPLPLDYTVFVHLVDGGGTLVAQGDGPPLGGRYPTTVWGPGEVIVDEHLIPLPTDLPAGDYTLLVGLYDPVSGQRLPLAVGGDSVVLADALRVR